jgi:outer membrane protein TolC
MASYQANDRDIPFGRDNDSWLVGATLRWELFDGMRRMNEVQSAQSERNAASSYLQNLRQDVAFEVREAMARRGEAEKRLEIARKALQETEEMVRLISRRFENALSTTVELLDAETALTRARAQLADNEANFALATAKVYHSSGLFRKEVMK